MTITKPKLWMLLARCRRVIRRLLTRSIALPLDGLEAMLELDREMDALEWPKWTGEINNNK